MSNESYGIVVEGDYDTGVYEELIQRVCGQEVQVVSRVAGDKALLMKNFPTLLRSLQHVTLVAGPPDKALVIRDADYKDVRDLEEQMRVRIAGHTFPFPGGIGFHAVRQEMETWLLADPNAINRVATTRRGRAAAEIRGPVEDIRDPKEKLQEVLSQARLNYTAQVCREIAREIDLDTLRSRCPSFAVFQQKVLDP